MVVTRLRYAVLVPFNMATGPENSTRWKSLCVPDSVANQLAVHCWMRLATLASSLYLNTDVLCLCLCVCVAASEQHSSVSQPTMSSISRSFSRAQGIHSCPGRSPRAFFGWTFIKCRRTQKSHYLILHDSLASVIVLFIYSSVSRGCSQLFIVCQLQPITGSQTVPLPFQTAAGMQPKQKAFSSNQVVWSLSCSYLTNQNYLEVGLLTGIKYNSRALQRLDKTIQVEKNTRRRQNTNLKTRNSIQWFHISNFLILILFYLFFTNLLRFYVLKCIQFM